MDREGPQSTNEPVEHSRDATSKRSIRSQPLSIPLMTVPLPHTTAQLAQAVPGNEAGSASSAEAPTQDGEPRPAASLVPVSPVSTISPGPQVAPSDQASTAKPDRHEHSAVLLIEGQPAASGKAVGRHDLIGQVRQLAVTLSERPIAPPLRSRRWLPMLIVSMFLAVSLGLALFAETSPLGNMAATQLRDGDLDLALQTLRNPGSAHQPSGPWDTNAAVAQLGEGGGAGPGTQAPGSAGLPVTPNAGPTTPVPQASRSPVSASTPPKAIAPTPTSTLRGGGTGSGTGIDPAPVLPWPPRWAYMAVPGHPAFAVKLPSNGYYWWAFGQCTWWAQYQRQDENLRRMGNARYWAAGARQRGYTVSSVPRKGATVVFQPGVEGAGGAGHVAHVVAVYPGGWFLVSEMNFYWNGGGWGRVSFRYAYARSGVSFIY